MEEPKSSMKGAGTIRWLKWELSEFETHDLEEFNLMLLRNAKGLYWATLTSCKVCVELQRASLMHSVASAPGFNAVTSPVETGLFGFSQRHQRSQSIFILHGYPLSQQHLIKRLKETPNLSRFAVKGARGHGWKRRKLQILWMWKSSIENMEKYFEVFRCIQMDVMVSHDTDFQSAGGDEIKLLPQLWWLDLREGCYISGAYRKKKKKVYPSWSKAHHCG